MYGVLCAVNSAASRDRTHDVSHEYPSRDWHGRGCTESLVYFGPQEAVLRGGGGGGGDADAHGAARTRVHPEWTYPTRRRQAVSLALGVTALHWM